MVRTMPSFVERINRTMLKHIPGDFIELRAFPESLFHLRPDESKMQDGIEDRAPFPRIADEQWISTNHNTYIFYAREDVSIHPFVANGDILGAKIDGYIRSMERLEQKSTAIGGILLKPDAIESGQLDIIHEKISTKLSEMGGRIITEKEIDRLTDEQIEMVYPLMRLEDLGDLKDYLQSGKVTAMLVELPCGPYEVFKAVNSIKGPRVGDRSIDRLYEGRKTDGAIRDLLPLPGDEEKYKSLINTILARRKDPTIRFTDENYKYYAKNLMHTPDNNIELNGLISLISGVTEV